MALGSLEEVVIPYPPLSLMSGMMPGTHTLSVQYLWNRCCINKPRWKIIVLVLASSSMKACKIYTADSYSIQQHLSTVVITSAKHQRQPKWKITEVKNSKGFMHSKGVCTAKITNSAEQHLIIVSGEPQQCSGGGDKQDRGRGGTVIWIHR